MEAAKKLQLHFIGLQPTRAETLGKEIAKMEEELKVKTKLINKQERLIKEQLDQQNIELERV
ncbi:mediator of RNA polymerase ii transcription subunit 28 [Phtheirospermum japonicum]|uniref:Mediator of RNA polymerase ii transcription subunit 28 n=1 Tax=Phtheirospermum japonicum TaxID=374723 RepID=A0A830C6M7_9LAMI|nr:mediator of RNA polymerase ii transcription subunit 28 [Phtheirospermum japonicum]